MFRPTTATPTRLCHSSSHIPNKPPHLLNFDPQGTFYSFAGLDAADPDLNLLNTDWAGMKYKDFVTGDLVANRGTWAVDSSTGRGQVGAD